MRGGEKIINKSSVAAIIITYNIGKDIIKCFESVRTQVDFIILVDNGSNIETIFQLKVLEKYNNVKVIYNNLNFGIAKALNQGVQYAARHKFEWVLLLDHDSKCTKGMLKTMLGHYYNLNNDYKSKIGIIVPKHIKVMDKEEDYYDQVNENDSIKFITAEITSGSLIKTELFKKVGYFEEKLFIDYVDFEFSLRIKSFGYSTALVGNAVLLHILGEPKYLRIFRKSFIYSTYSYDRIYYCTRNRFYVWNKYKKYEKWWILYDKYRFIRDVIKILFFQKNIFYNITAIFKGYKDYRSQLRF